ncbi:MAG: hypothetical protein D6814_16720 [Calditrichaeota bacterium]|nr:MAG: hypothetical protein D6814_16720 [Calditrichota bacterium]
MKTRINLTIEEELIPLTKQYAKEHGKSVSELVESMLRELLLAESPTFSEKWRGRFTLDQKNDPKFEKLRKRYEL